MQEKPMPRILKRTKTAILIVGEGFTEQAFLLHVKDLFVKRDSDISVKVERSNGGSPEDIIKKAIRLRDSKGYDKCFVLMDADVEFNPTAKIKKLMNKKPGMQIILSEPCIEGLLLRILGERVPDSSDACKRSFHNFISEDKKTQKRSYERLFTKDVLMDKRSNIPALNEILNILGCKFYPLQDY
jgi:hypothetical protein